MSHPDKEGKKSMNERDFLKSMGITVGMPSLVETAKESDVMKSAIQKGQANNGGDSGRVGIGSTPRSQLEKSLGGFGGMSPELQKSMMIMMGKAPAAPSGGDLYAKEDDNKDNFGAKNTKGSHGEEFHSDIDAEKTHKKDREEAEVVDHVHGADEQENPAVRYGVSSSVRRSLSQEQLFLKAMGMKKGPMKEFIDEEAKEGEHSKRAISKLKQFDKEEGEEEAHKGYMGFKKLAAKTSPAIAASVGRKKYGKEKFQEAAAEGKKLGKSALDELCDLIKGEKKPEQEDQIIDMVKEKPVRNLAKLHENSPAVSKKPVKKQVFLKSSGPGGMVFDFGPITGNPMADRATALLNQFADPVQEANAKYQENAYQKSLQEFAAKGEHAFMAEGGNDPFANLNGGKQLEKGMDEQVVEAFKKGLFDNAPGTPAVKNKFNNTEMNIGGTVIKATSETDAALIEMMKAQGMDLSGLNDGVVADATNGGKIAITAGE